MFSQITRWFPKEFKYTLWEKLKDHSLHLIIALYETNSMQDKIPWIQMMKKDTELIKTLMRIAKDMHICSIKQFVDVILVLYFPLFFVWTTLNRLNYHAQKYLKILLKRKKANQKNLKSFTFLLFYVYEDEAQGVYLS